MMFDDERHAVLASSSAADMPTMLPPTSARESRGRRRGSWTVPARLGLQLAIEQARTVHAAWKNGE
jgi:hypothetical protein